MKHKDMPAKKKLGKKQKGKKTKKGQKPKAQRTSPQRYLKEVKLELKKVAWPARTEVVVSTIIIAIAVLLFGAYTGSLDALFQFLLQLTTR